MEDNQVFDPELEGDARLSNTISIVVPPGLGAQSLYKEGTFFIHLSGSGARAVTDEAITAALVAKKMIPLDTALCPYIGWYREEDKPFSRVMFVE